MKFPVVITLLLICGFHILTIDFVPPTSDESVCSNFNNTGSFSLWEDMFAPSEQRAIGSIYTFDLVPNQRKVFALPEKLLGIGVFQQRILPLLGGLLALMVLFLILNTFGTPNQYLLLLSYFGLNSLFSSCVHIARVESIILLVFFLNLYWLTSGTSNRPYAVVAGLLFAFCFSLHPNTVIPLSATLALMFGWEDFDLKRFIRCQRYSWWVIGLTIGVLWYVFSIDIERTVISLQTAKGMTYSNFPFITYLFDPVGLLDKLGSRLLPFESRISHFMPFLIGISFGLSLSNLRKRSFLSKFEKFVTMVNLFTLISFAMFTASNTWAYQLYVFPWIILSILVLAIKQARAPDLYDDTDMIIFSICVLFFSPPLKSFYHLSIFALFAWALIPSMRKGNIFWKISSAAILMFLIYRHLFLSESAVFLGYMKIYFRHYPVRSLLLVSWPVLLFNRDLKLRFLEIDFKNQLTVTFSILVLMLNFIVDAKFVADFALSSKDIGDVDSVLAEIRKGKIIIGPSELWLYEPSGNIRRLEPLLDGKKLISAQYNPIRSILKIKPAFVLCRDNQEKYFVEEAKKLPGKEILVRKGRKFRISRVDFVQLYINEVKSKVNQGSPPS